MRGEVYRNVSFQTKGKTFKATSKFLDTVFKNGLVQEHLRGLGVIWQFNVKRAPWWGGAFERMVRSTKRCLKKVIGRAHFSLDELTTALAEIEAVINSQPLLYVASENMEKPITPSHSIVGHRILNLPDNLDAEPELSDTEFNVDGRQVTSRVRHLNQVLNHFWKRWRTEYQSDLREVHTYTIYFAHSCTVYVGLAEARPNYGWGWSPTFEGNELGHSLSESA